MLKETEKQFHLPAIPLKEGDRRRRDVQQIRRAQPCRRLRAPGVRLYTWIHGDLHQPDQCWEFVLFALTAQASHLVTHDPYLLGLGIQRAGFCDGKATVLPDATDIRRTGPRCSYARA